MTALARVLFARTDGQIDSDLYGPRDVPIPSDDRLVASFQPLIDAANGTLEVEVIDHGADATRTWSRPPSDRATPQLTVATLGPPPDRSTQRWSFSAIVDHAESADRADPGRFDPADSSMSDSGAGDERVSWETEPTITTMDGRE